MGRPETIARHDIVAFSGRGNPSLILLRYFPVLFTDRAIGAKKDGRRPNEKRATVVKMSGGRALRTYCEFSFDAAHSVAPYSTLHGHTFVVKLTFGGPADPVYGWPVNLYEVEKFIATVKGDHYNPGLDHSNLDLKPEIGLASLENVTLYLWKVFKAEFPGLEEVELKRGFQGSIEGCVYRGENMDRADLGLAA
jgi:6-pyruvoyltetrahydropterin/6-carboxytetrahydropterin synthase